MPVKHSCPKSCFWQHYLWLWPLQTTDEKIFAAFILRRPTSKKFLMHSAPELNQKPSKASTIVRLASAIALFAQSKTWKSQQNYYKHCFNSYFLEYRIYSTREKVGMVRVFALQCKKHLVEMIWFYWWRIINIVQLVRFPPTQAQDTTTLLSLSALQLVTSLGLWRLGLSIILK